jgi:hypothetical protein
MQLKNSMSIKEAFLKIKLELQSILMQSLSLDMALKMVLSTGWSVIVGEKLGGEKGFFRIIRGVNNLGIEVKCHYAVPEDTWSEPRLHHTTKEEREDPRNDYTNGPYPQFISDKNTRHG